MQLQVLGRDAPYYQPGAIPFTARTENLTVALPTLQRVPK